MSSKHLGSSIEDFLREENMLDWKSVQQANGRVVQKHPQQDAFWAEFLKLRENKKVPVRISVQDLKDFGETSNPDKATHTERVLRAVLEWYIAKVGEPKESIDARDLANHGLNLLKKAFKNRSE